MRCLLLSFLLLFLSLTVMAADEQPLYFNTREPADALSGPEYMTQAKLALKSDPYTNFGKLRGLYPNLEFYHPFGQQVSAELKALAQTVTASKTYDAHDTALKEFHDHVLKHIANIDVMITARDLSIEDERFGEPKIYQIIINGLLDSIRNSGSGAALQSAYRIVTVEEEALLLNMLNVQSTQTKTATEGRISYTMHRVKDPRAVNDYTLFMRHSALSEWITREYKPNQYRVPGVY